MWRPITFAIAVAILSLLALTFLEMGMSVTAKDAANAQSKRVEYTITSNPYLPIRRLGPTW